VTRAESALIYFEPNKLIQITLEGVFNLVDFEQAEGATTADEAGRHCDCADNLRPRATSLKSENNERETQKKKYTEAEGSPPIKKRRGWCGYGL
jgi:hypothetical protein